MSECFRCKRTPDNIPEYVEMAEVEGMSPEEYAQEDGTYNFETEHFACNECYMAVGMPSSPSGWKAP